MAQIVPRDSIGERLGTGLGAGLSQGLQLLAQQKMSELQQRTAQQKGARGLEALGFNQQESSQLAGLDPAIQREIVKQRLAAPQNEAYAQALSSILGGGQSQQTPSFGEAQLPETSAEMQTQGQTPSLKGLNAKQATDLAKIGIEQQKQGTKKQMAERKEFLDYVYPKIQKIHEKEQASKETDQVINRMIETAKTGNVQQGLVALDKVLQESGISLTPLLNADTQELLKLENFFLKDLKSIFGGRITQQEMQNYLKGTPNALQGAAGIERVGNLMLIQNKAAEKQAEVADKILEDHPNIKPEQFDKILAKEMKPWQKAYAEEFKLYGREKNTGFDLQSLPSIQNEPDNAKFEDDAGNIWIKNADKTEWVMKGK